MNKYLFESPEDHPTFQAADGELKALIREVWDEARKAEDKPVLTASGVVKFGRSEGDKVCICCPGEPNHIYTRGVAWEGRTAADAIYDFIRHHEGERITVTVALATAGNAK